MTDKPRIRIVSEGPLGNNTKVFTEDGTEISNAITEIDLHLKVDEVNTAELKAILVGAEIDAVVTDLQTKILPPPAPKAQYRFRITEGNKTVDKWVLEKVTPAPTLGVRTDFLCGGAVDKGLPMIELVGDAEE